jgi:hypothetical protein
VFTLKSERGAEGAAQPLALAVAVLIAAAGAFLRFRGLDRYGLWLDEAWLAAFSRLPLTDILRRQEVFFLVLKVAGNLWGYTEKSMRFSAALSGTLLIPAGYLLARRFLTVSGSAIVACLIATSPIAIAYSQESAVYSPLMLTVVLSLIFFLDYFETARRRYLALFLLTLSIAISLHVYSVMIATAAIAYFLASKGIRRRFRGFYLGAGLLAAMSAWRIGADWDAARQLAAFRARYPDSTPAVSYGAMFEFLKVIVMSWFDGPGGSYTPQSPYAVVREHATAFSGLILALFAVCLVRGLRQRGGHIRLLALIVAGFLFGALSLCYTTGSVFERYCLSVMPLCLILFVHAFHREDARFSLKLCEGAVIAALVVNFVTIQLFNRDKVPWKSAHDWRGMARALRADTDKPGRDHFAIFVPYNLETSLVDFYLPDLGRRVLRDDRYHSYLLDMKYVWLGPDEIKGYNLALLKSAKDSDIDTIYVPTVRAASHMAYIDAFLADTFRREKSSWNGTPPLYVYRRKGRASGPSQKL